MTVIFDCFPRCGILSNSSLTAGRSRGFVLSESFLFYFWKAVGKSAHCYVAKMERFPVYCSSHWEVARLIIFKYGTGHWQHPRGCWPAPQSAQVSEGRRPRTIMLPPGLSGLPLAGSCDLDNDHRTKRPESPPDPGADRRFMNQIRDPAGSIHT